MSDIVTINTNGLEEAIRCAICENPIKTERGCNGSCQYDKELHAKIVEAVMGIAEEIPPVYGETSKDIIEEIKGEADEIYPESELPITYSYYSGFRNGMLRAVAILRAERGDEK